MMKMLVTVTITKGFARWVEMTKSLQPMAEENGMRMIWAGTNPDETQVYVGMELQNAEQMKTFGEREDVVKARAEAGAIVESTTVISPIGQDYIPA